MRRLQIPNTAVRRKSLMVVWLHQTLLRLPIPVVPDNRTAEKTVDDGSTIPFDDNPTVRVSAFSQQRSHGLSLHDGSMISFDDGSMIAFVDVLMIGKLGGKMVAALVNKAKKAVTSTRKTGEQMNEVKVGTTNGDTGLNVRR